MSFVSVFIELLALFAATLLQTNGEVISCDDVIGDCKNTTQTCTTSGLCSFQCNIEEGCNTATLQCLNENNCEVTTSSKQACRDATIYCPNNANCSIIGSGGNGAYRSTEIYCGNNGYCEFLYNGLSDSNNIQFKFFNAINSSYLYVKRNGTVTPTPTLKTSRILCPINNDNNIPSNNCKVDCFSGVGSDTSCTELKIITVNGFNDVYITDTTNNVNITLVCGDNNEYECQVTSPNVNECSGYSGNHICDYVAPTLEPSIMPSLIPSNEPSNKPSYVPTNDPSDVPTPQPTNAPTIPTLAPTIMPSGEPTIAQPTATHQTTAVMSTRATAAMTSSIGTTTENQEGGGSGSDSQNTGVFGSLSSLSAELYIIIAVALILFLIFLCFCFWCFCCKRKQQKGLSNFQKQAELIQMDSHERGLSSPSSMEDGNGAAMTATSPIDEQQKQYQNQQMNLADNRTSTYQDNDEFEDMYATDPISKTKKKASIANRNDNNNIINNNNNNLLNNDFQTPITPNTPMDNSTPGHTPGDTRKGPTVDASHHGIPPPPPPPIENFEPNAAGEGGRASAIPNSIQNSILPNVQLPPQPQIQSHNMTPMGNPNFGPQNYSNDSHNNNIGSNNNSYQQNNMLYVNNMIPNMSMQSNFSAESRDSSTNDFFRNPAALAHRYGNPQQQQQQQQQQLPAHGYPNNSYNEEAVADNSVNGMNASVGENGGGDDGDSDDGESSASGLFEAENTPMGQYLPPNNVVPIGDGVVTKGLPSVISEDDDENDDNHTVK